MGGSGSYAALVALGPGRWRGREQGTKEGSVSRCSALLPSRGVRNSVSVGSGPWELREPFPDVARLHRHPQHQVATTQCHLYARRFGHELRFGMKLKRRLATASGRSEEESGDEQIV